MTVGRSDAAKTWVAPFDLKGFSVIGLVPKDSFLLFSRAAAKHHLRFIGVPRTADSVLEPKQELQIFLAFHISHQAGGWPQLHLSP